MKHSETGLIFKVEDTNDLVNNLLFAMDNLPKMKIFAETLKKEIQEKYNRDLVQSSLLKKYRQLSNVN